MWLPNSSFEDVYIIMLSCINLGVYWGLLTSSWGVSVCILFITQGKGRFYGHVISCIGIKSPFITLVLNPSITVHQHCQGISTLYTLKREFFSGFREQENVVIIAKFSCRENILLYSNLQIVPVAKVPGPKIYDILWELHFIKILSNSNSPKIAKCVPHYHYHSKIKCLTYQEFFSISFIACNKRIIYTLIDGISFQKYHLWLTW